MTAPARGGPRLPERPAPPQTRVDLVGALLSTAVAALALVVALAVELSPPRQLAAVLLVAVPVLGVVALPVVVSRARARRDSPLGWFAAGLTVSVAAGILQTLSFPTVLPDGGPLRTEPTGSAQLYLLMHVALPAGVLAAAFGVPGRWRRRCTWAGLALALACALDLVPTAALLRADGGYTPYLVASELLVGWLSAVATVLWVRNLGRSVTALRTRAVSSTRDPVTLWRRPSAISSGPATTTSSGCGRDSPRSRHC